MGTQSENQFRAEIRDANNEVKGVYSWLDASGNEHTVVFNSGKDGYKIMPLEESGIELPPFPYGLYGDKPEEIQARTLTKSVDCIEPGWLTKKILGCIYLFGRHLRLHLSFDYILLFEPFLVYLRLLDNYFNLFRVYLSFLLSQVL